MRWRATKPPEARTEVLEALAYAPPCPQVGVRLDPEYNRRYHGDEDCLYLNIFAPRFAPNDVPQGVQKLPVMVWIHGGGNAIGKPGWTPYAYKLAGDYNVVVVTISYRLGLLGWFYNDALHDENDSPEDRSGNYGTLDMIAALKWVRTNITNFGGDPSNVTIFGESAGGRNVYALMASPLAKNLFHKAIVQSGVLRSHSKEFAQNFTDDQNPGAKLSSNEVILALLQKQGEAKNRKEAKQIFAKMTKEQKQKLLRFAHPQELVTLYTDEKDNPVMTHTANIFNDGHVLPNEDPMETFADVSKFNNVPLITGTNRDETKLLIFSDRDLVKMRLWLFPKVIDLDKYNKISEYGSKNWSVRAVDNVAQLLSKQNGTNVYAYRFDWDESPEGWLANFKDLFGAAHAFEIPFVFHAMENKDDFIPGTFTDDNSKGRQEVSNAMSSYWVEFAKTGKPGKGVKGELPEWRAWNPEKDGVKRIIFDTQTDGGIRMSSEFITKESLKNALLNDKDIDDETRCNIYYHTFATNFYGQIPEKDGYETFSNGLCKNYPQGEDKEKTKTRKIKR